MGRISAPLRKRKKSPSDKFRLPARAKLSHWTLEAERGSPRPAGNAFLQAEFFQARPSRIGRSMFRF
jgi:hypothetical protein